MDPHSRAPAPRLSMSILLKGTRLLTRDDAALLSGRCGVTGGPNFGARTHLGLDLGPHSEYDSVIVTRVKGWLENSLGCTILKNFARKSLKHSISSFPFCVKGVHWNRYARLSDCFLCRKDIASSSVQCI